MCITPKPKMETVAPPPTVAPAPTPAVTTEQAAPAAPAGSRSDKRRRRLGAGQFTIDRSNTSSGTGTNIPS